MKYAFLRCKADILRGDIRQGHSGLRHCTSSPNELEAPCFVLPGLQRAAPARHGHAKEAFLPAFTVKELSYSHNSPVDSGFVTRIVE